MDDGVAGSPCNVSHRVLVLLGLQTGCGWPLLWVRHHRRRSVSVTVLRFISSNLELKGLGTLLYNGGVVVCCCQLSDMELGVGANTMAQDIPTEQQQQLALRIKYLKLKRINDLNGKLRNELGRDRITASNASLSVINYTLNNVDYVLPDIWGYPDPGVNHFRNSLKMTRANRHPASAQSAGCCTIV